MRTRIGEIHRDQFGRDGVETLLRLLMRKLQVAAKQVHAAFDSRPLLVELTAQHVSRRRVGAVPRLRLSQRSRCRFNACFWRVHVPDP
jgi:hypothetical protein